MHKSENIDSSEFSGKIKNSRDFKREQERREYEATKKIALTVSSPENWATQKFRFLFD